MAPRASPCLTGVAAGLGRSSHPSVRHNAHIIVGTAVAPGSIGCVTAPGALASSIQPRSRRAVPSSTWLIRLSMQRSAACLEGAFGAPGPQASLERRTRSRSGAICATDELPSRPPYARLHTPVRSGDGMPNGATRMRPLVRGPTGSGGTWCSSTLAVLPTTPLMRERALRVRSARTPPLARSTARRSRPPSPSPASGFPLVARLHPCTNARAGRSRRERRGPTPAPRQSGVAHPLTALLDVLAQHGAIPRHSR